MKQATFILAVLLTVPLTVPSLFGTGSAALADSSADHVFAKQAAQDNLAEIKMGQLAQEKGSRSDVKEYGAKLVKDHTAANEKLQSIAKQNEIMLPTDPTAEQKEAHAMLAKESGNDFDRKFMKHMVADHKKAIEMFETQAGGSGDSTLKGFAKNTIPTLREHLQIAENISGKIQ